MRLTVLGCAGSMPGPDSPCSCYLVEADGFRMLLDMGTGSLGALQRQGLLFDVDAIVISHLHPDHCADLASYLVARKYYSPSGEQLEPLAVHGPAGTADRIAAIAGPGLGEHVRDIFDFRTLLPGDIEVGPFSVRVARMSHPVETFGSRVEHGGSVLAYSADTGPCDALIDLARDADLFLCEASVVDDVNNRPDLHLSGKQAGEHAAKAKARKLLLTHFVTAAVKPATLLDEARQVFGGEVEQARPDWVYEI